MPVFSLLKRQAFLCFYATVYAFTGIILLFSRARIYVACLKGATVDFAELANARCLIARFV